MVNQLHIHVYKFTSYQKVSYKISLFSGLFVKKKKKEKKILGVV